MRAVGLCKPDFILYLNPDPNPTPSTAAYAYGRELLDRQVTAWQTDALEAAAARRRRRQQFRRSQAVCADAGRSLFTNSMVVTSR